MNAFGVRFVVNDAQRFASLRSLYVEIKRDKDTSQPRDADEWVLLVPDEVKGAFSWPTPEERTHWLGIRDSVVTAIPEPSEQLGAEWDFYRVFEALDEGDYDVLGCEQIEPGVGELQIDPHGYPYGGVSPLIALVEAFGFRVLGVNECGKYESREQLRGEP